MQEVLVSLSAYGATEVRRDGQAAFARIALDAGADGVEMRGELLTDAATELPA
ncbi:MAG TPA: glutamine ABC transporter ATP-binding protein, partial [Ramlibacter sp.]